MDIATKNVPTDLIDALGIRDLEPAEQEELLLDLGDLVFRGSMLRIIELMDEATQKDFESLLEHDASEDQIAAFLKERVPGADQSVQETLDELRSDILAVTS